MGGKSVSDIEAADNQDDGQGRQRSTIGFPYMGLSDAIEVAEAIHRQVGSGDCDDTQLAAWLDLSSKSSGYRVRISAARMFGVIESSGGVYKLTRLGMDIVDPELVNKAKVEAFLNVPLFAKVYENWQNRQLPPRAGFERELVGLGVAEKQKDRARQVLERSAQTAGFFEHGKNRLVKPGFKPDEKVLLGQKEKYGGGGGGEGPTKLDPVIQGLIDKLPAPKSVWREEERQLWLQILENSFKLVYKDGRETETRGSAPSKEDIFTE